MRLKHLHETRLTTREEIEKLVKNLNATSIDFELIINNDLTVDIEGSLAVVRLGQLKNLTKLPFQFGKCTGTFSVSKSKLVSLEGCPSFVGGNFYVGQLEISSLVGSPKEVTGIVSISGCESLTTLEGCPQIVGASFRCVNTSIASLKYGPKEVGSGYEVDENKLIDLSGAPKEINGDFTCEDNKLTTLSGGPREVGGDYWCRGNKLTSFEGVARIIGKDFHHDIGGDSSSKGYPKDIGGSDYGSNS